MIQLPDINHPVVNSNGIMDKDWYDFFNEVVVKVNDLETRVIDLEP